MSKIYLKSVKLEAFKNFLNVRSIEWREPPNSAIILQIKQGKEWLGVYKRDNYPLTLTVDKRLINILEAFEKRNDSVNSSDKLPEVLVIDSVSAFNQACKDATLNSQQVQRVGRAIRPTKKPFKIDWVYVAFFTLVLFVGLFVGYGIKTQCPNLADNIYIKCSK